MSVKSVKKLMELTGCSSVDCRNAIEYCDNNFDTAYKYLQFINQAKTRYKMVYGVRVPWKKEDYRNEARKYVSKLNIKTLKEFLELEDDWDGEGAKKFDKEFIDFIPFIQDCRYVGCSHIYEQEKECSVKRAVLNGKLSKSRYDNFVKIYKELEENYKRRYN